MVVLTCKECGSINVARGEYIFEFVCKDCGSELELWKIRFREINENDLRKKLLLGIKTT